MKTILCHISDEASIDQRVQSALAVARCFGGHVRFLQIMPYDAFVAADGFGGIYVLNDLIKAVEEQQEATSDRLEREMAREDVSWDVKRATGSIAHTIASYAALADLVVTGRVPRGTPDAISSGNLPDIVQKTRTPVLVPAADSKVIDPTAPALIAWDRSFEAAAAIKQALPLLRMASAVHVATVSNEPHEPGSFPATAVLEYLSRHGVHAELREVRRGGDDPALLLVGTAHDVGARLVVAGAYHHNRIGEFWMGGVTRTLLGDCPLSLLLAR
ncbi:universal stress protein [Sphingomonas sp. KRR8]|uniref:universal stress protein n=1 Tax=Sphingomonas sp. KRR8 TaxID=2942996 RepID=UPI0020220563|nr:universal stress protein [Sphingomonas sp. KRR8]URD61365.1 universal stress protein [Sphingomonas sp. KRR8]